MTDMNVTYDELTSAALHLRNEKEAVKEKLLSLGTYVENLVGSGFQTQQASGAYKTSFDQFVLGTNQAVEGLEGLAAFLDSAATALQETDAALAAAQQG